jgi:hypothetical protein
MIAVFSIVGIFLFALAFSWAMAEAVAILAEILT